MNGFKHNNNSIRLTIKEFQVLLLNTNNSSNFTFFLRTQLNCCKYWCVSSTMNLNISHLLNKISNSSICLNSITWHLFAHSFKHNTIDWILSSATTPGHNCPGINNNEEVTHISQSSSIHDQIVWCHIQETRWGREVLPSAEI